MLGGHNNGGWAGAFDDWIDLYELGESGNDVTLTKVAKKQMYCNWTGAGDPCIFRAASGTYVDPDGNLIVYSSEYDNDGPSSGGVNTVKMAEFRHAAVLSHDYTCDSAWLELYDDDNGPTTSDRSMVLDYADRNLNNWDDFRSNFDSFNDKASSGAFCAPVGCTLKIYENENYGGDVLQVSGTGNAVYGADLGQISCGAFCDWGDRITSARFTGTCN